MENKLVSIIIPAYNVSKYISKGIKSCIGQTYANIEIIVVDDGSTDNTWGIISGWQKKDDRIKMIHQKNQGVSASRNAGLDCVDGEYVLFLDGDDWLEKDAVEYLMGLMGKREDVIVSSAHYEAEYENGKLRRHRCGAASGRFIPADKMMQLSVGGSYGLGSACYKLYPMCVIKNVRFDSDIYNMEDLLFLFYAVSQSKGIIYSAEPKWNVLTRAGSFTQSKYSWKHLTAITAIERMMAYNENSEIWSALVCTFWRRALQLLNSALIDPAQNKEDIVYLRRKIESYMDLGIFYGEKFKTLLNAFLILHLPIGAASIYRKMAMVLIKIKRGIKKNGVQREKIRNIQK